MFRYKLRTLLIVLALGPPMLAAAWWCIQTGAVDRAVEVLFSVGPWIAATTCEYAMTFGLPVVAMAYCAARFAAAVTKR